MSNVATKKTKSTKKPTTTAKPLSEAERIRIAGDYLADLFPERFPASNGPKAPVPDYSDAAIRAVVVTQVGDIFADMPEITEATPREPGERHLLADLLFDQAAEHPCTDVDLYDLLAAAAVRSGDLAMMRAAMGCILRFKAALKIECDARRAAKGAA